MRRMLLALGVALMIVGCSKQVDPQKIHGRWVAENFRFQGLKLPISPDLQISDHQLILGSGIEPLQLKGLEADGDEVTLQTTFGIDLVFRFESDDRIYFTVPILGERIYYHRAKAAAAVVPSNVAVPAAVTSPTPRAVAPEDRVVAPSAKPQSAQQLTPEKIAPAPSASRSMGEAHYQQSLAALQRRDKDAALRALSLALSEGFNDWPRIRQERAFDVLREDVRYQVMESRWK